MIDCYWSAFRWWCSKETARLGVQRFIDCQISGLVLCFGCSLIHLPSVSIHCPSWEISLFDWVWIWLCVWLVFIFFSKTVFLYLLKEDLTRKTKRIGDALWFHPHVCLMLSSSVPIKKSWRFTDLFFCQIHFQVTWTERLSPYYL